MQDQFPKGIEGLLDLVSNPAGFGEYATLVRAGGVALTTNFVADEKALTKRNVRGGNFVLGATPKLVERLGKIAGDGKLKVTIEKRVSLDETIAAIAAAKTGQSRGKTIITI